MVILNTCHIREKAAEKVYSELGRIRRLKEDARAEGRRAHDRGGGRLRGPGRRRGDDRPRAGGRYRGGPAILSPPARDDRQDRARQRPCARNRFSGRRQIRRAARRSARRADPPRSSPCRKVATSSAPSAWCPTRAARNSRGPSRRSKPRRGAWSTQRRARDHAARPERQRLSRRWDPMASRGRLPA